MPITKSLNITSVQEEHKIEEIRINVETKQIEVIIRTTTLLDGNPVSASKKKILALGARFQELSQLKALDTNGAVISNSMNMYDNLATLLYQKLQEWGEI